MIECRVTFFKSCQIFKTTWPKSTIFGQLFILGLWQHWAMEASATDPTSSGDPGLCTDFRFPRFRTRSVRLPEATRTMTSSG